MYLRPRVWWTVCSVCVALMAWTDARAAVIAPAPGQTVETLFEEVVLVFDPLTGQQTTLVQHVFSGTATPFGLIVPTPRPADARRVSDRVMLALDAALHPKAKVHRVLDLNFTSWVGNCALREVGDLPDDSPRTPTLVGSAGETTPLGNTAEPLHDWVLENGFTLAPAQVVWLDELRSRGWSLTGVVVRPPIMDGAPPERLRGPLIALSHEAEEPIYAAGHPPAAIDAQRGARPPRLDLAVLTEWPVGLDAEQSPEPTYLDALDGREVARIAQMGGEPRWSFRRDGTLTQFPIDRPDGPGIVRFVRVAPRPSIRPEPAPITRVHRVGVPIEVMVMAFAALVWGWIRWGRRRAEPPGRMSF